MRNLTDQSTLAEIAEAIRSARNPRPVDQTHDAFWENAWEVWDGRFEHRPDYRLWRSTLKLDYPTHRSEVWRRSTTLIREALNAEAAIVSWGSLAVLNRLFSNSRAEEILAQQQFDDLDLATVYAFSASHGLEPIANGEAGCAMTRLFSLNALRAYNARLGNRFTHEQAKDYLSELCLALSDLDSDWKPGRLVLLDRLRWETHNGRLIALGSYFEQQVYLRDVLARTRGWVLAPLFASTSLLETMTIDESLSLIAGLAQSAWRFAHWLSEISVGNRKRDNHTPGRQYASNSPLSLRTASITSAWNYQSSLIDSGKPLEAAAVAVQLLFYCARLPEGEQVVSPSQIGFLCSCATQAGYISPEAFRSRYKDADGMTHPLSTATGDNIYAASAGHGSQVDVSEALLSAHSLQIRLQLSRGDRRWFEVIRAFNQLPSSAK